MRVKNHWKDSWQYVPRTVATLPFLKPVTLFFKSLCNENNKRHKCSSKKKDDGLTFLSVTKLFRHETTEK